MSAKNKRYLTDVAKKIGKDDKYVLSALMPHDIIFSPVDNVNLWVRLDESDHPYKLTSIIRDIKINEDYLQTILRKGKWTGKVMLSTLIFTDDNPHVPADEAYPMHIRADDSLTISIDDLFVFEDTLAELESRHPDLFMDKSVVSTDTEISPRVEDTLYALIHILTDMLVDRNENNTLRLPEENDKYIYKNHGQLIERIEKYEVHGCKKSRLRDSFKEAAKRFNKKTGRNEEIELEEEGTET